MPKDSTLSPWSHPADLGASVIQSLLCWPIGNIQLLHYDGENQHKTPRDILTVPGFHQSTQNFLTGNEVSQTLNSPSWFSNPASSRECPHVPWTRSLMCSLTGQHFVNTPKETVISTGSMPFLHHNPPQTSISVAVRGISRLGYYQRMR